MSNFGFTIVGIIFTIGYFVTGVPLRIYVYSQEPSYRHYATIAIIKLAITDTAKWTFYNAKYMLPILFMIDIAVLCLK